MAFRSGPGVARSRPCPRRTRRSPVATPPSGQGAEIAWDDGALDEDCRSWARAAVDSAAPHASVGRYVNDVTEVGRDVARVIYGDAKYERLVALKREWDPDNVFRLNQNITP